ncbi:hypothetical protein GP486_001352 [Trichoglossum hirsutum]|uniref:Uncharacterized protein n=1 Tax=Trichoglossum hirsutum TaxID=265104 RepID=A0A9P8LG75_9PEZI|nr:hypothetical protein GP486_001352 [Trichoglossum hirsutum]
MPNHVQLQVDVLNAPITALSLAVALYQNSRVSRRTIDWRLVSFSSVLNCVTPQSKAVALRSVADTHSAWWKGRWWCGSQLGPFWDRLALDQTDTQRGSGQALLAMALELSSVMSSTETAEVILSLLQPADSYASKAVIKPGDRGTELLVGDIMPALNDLPEQGGRNYMINERSNFEKAILHQIGAAVPIASAALMGSYTPTDVNTAIHAIGELISAPEDSVLEISCQAGAIKLAFLLHTLFGITVNVVAKRSPNMGTVPGTYRRRHTLRIYAQVGTMVKPSLFTPRGSLLSAQSSYSRSHSIHSEACVEHISVILTRWQRHWAVPYEQMRVFSRCLFRSLCSWWRECAFFPSTYNGTIVRLGAQGHDGSGWGKPVSGCSVSAVTDINHLKNVYTQCLGEFAINEEDIEVLLSEEAYRTPPKDAYYSGTDEGGALTTMLENTCHCNKHLAKGSARPPGLSGHCSVDGGRVLYSFIARALWVLTMIDIEEPILSSSADNTGLTEPVSEQATRQLGFIYHGTVVRQAVGSLPDGKGQVRPLFFAHLLHAAALLFSGPAGGSAADNKSVVGICANGVAVVGSFCLFPTISKKDCRINVSFGRTFFQGSQVKRLDSYDQNVFGSMPKDFCYGKPQPSQGMIPSFAGIDDPRLTKVVNLRDDVATIAFRMQWANQGPQAPCDILASPQDYLQNIGRHVHLIECEHDPNAPLQTEGTIRVCPAGVFPKLSKRANEPWPDGYIASPNLPSPSGFSGCLALTMGSLVAQLALTCDAGVGQEIVLQRDCCLECACAQAVVVGATLVMCS